MRYIKCIDKGSGSYIIRSVQGFNYKVLSISGSWAENVGDYDKAYKGSPLHMYLSNKGDEFEKYKYEEISEEEAFLEAV